VSRNVIISISPSWFVGELSINLQRIVGILTNEVCGGNLQTDDSEKKKNCERRHFLSFDVNEVDVTPADLLFFQPLKQGRQRTLVFNDALTQPI